MKQFVRVHLNNEINTIGSGVRILFVHSVGPKYVRVRDLALRPARIKRNVWDKLNPVPCPVKKTLLKSIFKSRGHTSKTAKEMLV